MVSAGTLGTLVTVQMNERLDHEHSSAYRRRGRRLKANSGRLMNEKCSHDIDIMCWLKEGQGEAVEVFFYGGDQMFPKKETPSDNCSTCSDRTCPFRLQNVEELNKQRYVHSLDLKMQDSCIFKTDANVLTHQSMTVIFSDGCQGTFHITLYSGDPDRDIIIHGTEGYLAGSLNSGKFTVNTYRGNKTMVYDTGVVNNQHGGADGEVTREFFYAIMNGGAPEAKVIDAATASRIAFAADLSVLQGRKVSLNEFPY
jgi:predicted dehydrogenase